MNYRPPFIIALALSVIGIAGCKQNSSSSPAAATWANADADPQPAAFPDLSPSRLIRPGIRFQEATLSRGNIPMRVWLYQPAKAQGKLPLVLVAPAGSTLFCGMDMGDGDRAEHFPYAKAGFAVVSFDIDGHVPNLDKASDKEVLQAAAKFRDARAGLANAKVALDFVLAKAPDVDPNRVYIAGHSSAATLALLAASQDSRIKACAAYAPCTDVETRLARALPQLDRALPGYRDFIRWSSPKSHAGELKCPVFLFHALDDSNLSSQESAGFAAQVKPTNPNVTLVTTPHGDHYDSMIREGLPKGIEWFRELDTGSPAPAAKK